MKIISTGHGDIILKRIEKNDSYELQIRKGEIQEEIILSNSELEELTEYLSTELSFYKGRNILLSHDGFQNQRRAVVLTQKSAKGQIYAQVMYIGGNFSTSDVLISLPQDNLNLFDIERIQNACGDFMEALGYELEIKNEPVFGSFFQKIKFKLKQPKTQAEIDDLYNKGKQALEAKYLNLPTAEATEKIVNSASKIIESLATIDEAAIRLGAIIIVKIKKDGKTIIVSETVSPALASSLDNMPNILSNPDIVYDLLKVDKMENDLFKSDEDVKVIK